jgi:hypothetical protein
MTRTAEGDQVFGAVAPTGASRFDVMDFKELRVITTSGPAPVPITGQDHSASWRGNGGRVALAGAVNPGITLHCFNNLFPDSQFSL